MEATSSVASEVPNLTYLGLSGVNREFVCNILAILFSPCMIDEYLKYLFYSMIFLGFISFMI